MRQVVWSESAQEDYLEILRRIAADDPFATENVVDAIAKARDSLGDFATGHPGRIGGTYEKSVSGLPYIIAYCLTDGDRTVAILRVIHAAGDWNEDQWPDWTQHGLAARQQRASFATFSVSVVCRSPCA